MILCLLTIPTSASADAIARCQGNRECIKAVRAALKPTKEQIAATAAEIAEREAKDFIRERGAADVPAPAPKNDQEWAAYFDSPAGRRHVADTVASIANDRQQTLNSIDPRALRGRPGLTSSCTLSTRTTGDVMNGDTTVTMKCY
jgi:hypothetical protein